MYCIRGRFFFRINDHRPTECWYSYNLRQRTSELEGISIEFHFVAVHRTLWTKFIVHNRSHFSPSFWSTHILPPLPVSPNLAVESQACRPTRMLLSFSVSGICESCGISINGIRIRCSTDSLGGAAVDIRLAQRREWCSLVR